MVKKVTALRAPAPKKESATTGKTAPKPKEAAAAGKISPAVKKSVQEYFYAAGKRKTAVARVRLYPKGKGLITVNQKPMNEYFRLLTSAGVIASPLRMTGLAKEFDVSIKVTGGGVSSQAEAVRHGIARALLIYNDGLRVTLKKAGFLTRDSRI